MSHHNGVKPMSGSTGTTATTTTNTATLTVLRSNGIKDEITCSLESTTLRDFKILISQSNVLGMVPMNQQRIFHYGRELKTSGRTLQALGIGRFTNNGNKKAGPKIVIHLHAIPAAQSSDNNDIQPTVAVASTNNHRLTASTPTRTTRSATRATPTSSISNVLPTTSRTSSVSVRHQLPPTEVVDLYSDDENDDVVMVVNKPTSSTTTTTSATNNHSNKRRKT